MSAEGRQFALQVIEAACKDEGFLEDWNLLSVEERELGLLYYEQVYDGTQSQKGKKLGWKKVNGIYIEFYGRKND